MASSRLVGLGEAPRGDGAVAHGRRRGPRGRRPGWPGSIRAPRSALAAGRLGHRRAAWRCAPIRASRRALRARAGRGLAPGDAPATTRGARRSRASPGCGRARSCAARARPTSPRRSRFARRAGSRLAAVRSGGHCFAGRSSLGPASASTLARCARSARRAATSDRRRRRAPAATVYDALDPPGAQRIAAGAARPSAIAGLALGARRAAASARRHAPPATRRPRPRRAVLRRCAACVELATRPPRATSSGRLRPRGGCRSASVDAPRPAVRCRAPLTTTLSPAAAARAPRTCSTRGSAASPYARRRASAASLLLAARRPRDAAVVRGAVARRAWPQPRSVARAVARAGRAPSPRRPPARQLRHRDAASVTSRPRRRRRVGRTRSEVGSPRAPMPADVIGALVASSRPAASRAEHRSAAAAPHGAVRDVRRTTARRVRPSRPQRVRARARGASPPALGPDPAQLAGSSRIRGGRRGLPQLPRRGAPASDAAIGVGLERGSRVAAARPRPAFAAASAAAVAPAPTRRRPARPRRRRHRRDGSCASCRASRRGGADTNFRRSRTAYPSTL